MFYSYQSSLRTAGRLKLLTVGNHKLKVGYQYYKDGEVNTDPHIINYREFIFPKIAEDRFPGFKCCYRKKENEQIPDIYSQSEWRSKRCFSS